MAKHLLHSIIIFTWAPGPWVPIPTPETIPIPSPIGRSSSHRLPHPFPTPEVGGMEKFLPSPNHHHQWLGTSNINKSFSKIPNQCVHPKVATGNFTRLLWQTTHAPPTTSFISWPCPPCMRPNYFWMCCPPPFKCLLYPMFLLPFSTAFVTAPQILRLAPRRIGRAQHTLPPDALL